MKAKAREAAKSRLVELLKREMSIIDGKLKTNRRAMHALVDEQTVLKREKAEIGKLHRELLTTLA